MKKIFDYFIVIIQLILFAAYWWQPEKIASFLPEVWKYTGIVLMIAGGLITLIAMLQLNKHFTMLPSPTEQSMLRTNGVFGIMRHPVYAGVIYFAIGFALFKLDFTKLLLSIVLILFFELKTIYEEKQLKIRFPDYEAYRQRTGKFFPTFQKKVKKEDGAQDHIQ